MMKNEIQKHIPSAILFIETPSFLYSRYSSATPAMTIGILAAAKTEMATAGTKSITPIKAKAPLNSNAIDVKNSTKKKARPILKLVREIFFPLLAIVSKILEASLLASLIPMVIVGTVMPAYYNKYKIL